MEGRKGCLEILKKNQLPRTGPHGKFFLMVPWSSRANTQTPPMAIMQGQRLRRVKSSCFLPSCLACQTSQKSLFDLISPRQEGTSGQEGRKVGRRIREATSSHHGYSKGVPRDARDEASRSSISNQEDKSLGIKKQTHIINGQVRKKMQCSVGCGLWAGTDGKAS